MPNERKQISKSLRFEVLKRDNYTCQYCGQAAPEVVLNIDHMIPVSKGGTNDFENLVTSCSSCNQGKSDRVLDDHSFSELQIKLASNKASRLEKLLEVTDRVREIQNKLESDSDDLAEQWAHLVDLDTEKFSLEYSLIKSTFKDFLNSFSLSHIQSGMMLSYKQYISGNSNLTNNALRSALLKVGGICWNTRDRWE